MNEDFKAVSIVDFLEEISELELRELILSLADGCKNLALDRNAWFGYANSANYLGQLNQSGDNQIALDVYADNLFWSILFEKKIAFGYVSEERGDEIAEINQAKKYTVAIDPLDGSSLVDCNLAVGTIIGIYETCDLSGNVGSKLVASMYAVYGPQLVLVLAYGGKAYKFAYLEGDDIAKYRDQLVLVQREIKVAEVCSYFAPGGLAQVNEDPRYKELVDYWISHSYKLRYSGGMVPDVHHILAKGQGVFCYPGLPTKPEGKLRVLYEAMPMAQIMEAAGGKADSGRGRILDIEVNNLHQSTPICLGSSEEVERFIAKFAE